MIANERVLAVILFLAPALAAAVLVTLARAVLLARRARRDERLIAFARAHLVAAAMTPGIDVSAVRRLPFNIQTRALVNLARSITGPEQTNLRSVAERLGIAARAERMCASTFWWRRLYGMRILTVLGFDSKVIVALMRDSNPLVRAQAAEWLTTRFDDARIDLLLDMVYDAVAFCRFSAKDALLRIGAPAVPHITSRLVLARGREALPLLQIAAGIPTARFAEPALRLAGDPDPEVRCAAADVLGAMGGPRAAESLITMLEDEDASVVAAATNALGRAEHWPAAGRLAELLKSEWLVRRAAAQALRQMAAPGMLLLHRAARDPASAEGAAAQQAIDLTRTEQLA